MSNRERKVATHYHRLSETMPNSKNWNKKATLFASGLVCALCFRVPISTASFCVTRFNLDPSYLNIFTSRLVNAMLIGQMFGNWLGVLLTALDGKGKLWAIVVATWLCVFSYILALFCFCHSEEGHLTGYYWSIVIANIFSKVSEAQCFEIAPPESTNWYVSTFSLSATYILLIKLLLRVLINWSDEKNRVHRVMDISARSVKTTIDYRVCMLMFVITIILIFLISVLLTTVSIIATTGNLESSNIKWLKYVTGVSIGGILSVPGALFWAAVGSLFVKCLKFCFKEAPFVKLVECRQIIFSIVGAVVVFVTAIGASKHVPDEAEQWVPCFKSGVNSKILYYGVGGFAAGTSAVVLVGGFIGECTCAKSYGVLVGALTGTSMGIVAGLSIFGVNELHKKMSDTEIDENKVREKVVLRDIPTLNAIRGWAAQLDPSEATGTADQHNNKWAKALQKVAGGSLLTDQGTWNLSSGSVTGVSVNAGLEPNQITITVKGVKGAKIGQKLVSGATGVDKIKTVLQTLFDREFVNGAVMVTDVTGTANGNEEILLTVTMNPENNKWANTMRNMNNVKVKKKGGTETMSLENATVDVSKVVQMGVSNKIRIVVGALKTWSEAADLKSATERVINATLQGDHTLNVAGNSSFTMDGGNIKIIDGDKGTWNLSSGSVTGVSVNTVSEPNQITITVKGVKGAKIGQKLVSGATGVDKIKEILRGFFNTEFEGAVAVKDVTGKGIAEGMINLTVTVSGELHESGLQAITKTVQKVFDDAFGKGAVKAKILGAEISAVEIQGMKQGRITITVTGENRWENAIQNLHTLKVAPWGKEWNLSQAKIDYKSNAVRWEHEGKTITIRVTDVIGAKFGDMLYSGAKGAKNIKTGFQIVVSEIFETGALKITRVVGRGTDNKKIEITLTLGIDDETAKWRDVKETGGKLVRETNDAVSLKKSEVICGWVSSVIMSVLSQGTIYSVYPGMAPCSITDSSYFNKINIVIQIVSTIPSIVIIYVSETSGGPEKRWEEEGKRWYVGLLFVILQIVSMIIVVSVVHRPNSKLAKALTANPVAAGVLTVLMVLCQVTSTSIGYAGVVANSGFTMMSFNNTATLTTSVSMSLLGEGYLTEVKKYEPGMWPTQGMGKWATYKWWCGKAFRNAWQILLRICTTDLRLDLTLFEM